ncbi:chorismate-binding protein [Canibacter sp. lx-45]|uniref:chorismate-binding protein n=1 Tax=Canibacter zhuwentaonis TaxID=2837491 RepID=UPI001BDC09BD|nr:chorismate-binding protein [Canibacter zhuwentaonis]MBT1035077.1 chorismate-binding protein [Canibacter zhuwentaonis]
MPVTTLRSEFNALRDSQMVVSVCRELFADADTPVNIYRKTAADRPGTFLLESAAQGIFDRYSFVGVNVFGVLTEAAGRAKWIPGLSTPIDEQRLFPHSLAQLDPVAALAAVYERWQSAAHPQLPPLVSGFVGYLGWDSVAEFDGVALKHAPAADSVPRQYLGFVADLVVIDHLEGRLILIANVLCDDAAESADAQWECAQQRLNKMQHALAKSSATPLATIDDSALTAASSAITAERFTEMVTAAKKHIVDGNIFQVVLSQRFEHECTAAPLDVYRVLRHLNPSPYLYLLNAHDAAGIALAIVGSSPEALVTVKNGDVLTHPIAGSRPRGANIQEDAALAAELLADQKERSEHLMLVDLSRNDLSRVCEPGSVKVTEFMQIERFSHVTHISSTVKGCLRADKTPVDALIATFPAGTLSGAPKPWALRIINDFEHTPRGVYGGVVGYFGLGGSADLAIAIRTATIKNGVAVVQAGAGIVADSVAVNEAQECHNKAAAPLRAVALANSLTDAAVG